ncbi:MAG: hypothetical protein ABSB22_03035 [Thermodesulfobacteriota bacterium]|jgi:hypothetical protein
MDLNALKARTAELQQRLTQKPSDYEALRSLGIVNYAAALKDSKTKSIKENHYEP